MEKNIRWTTRLCCTTLVAGTIILAGVGPVLAEPPGRQYRDTPRADRGDHAYRSEKRGKHDSRDTARAQRKDARQGVRDNRGGDQRTRNIARQGTRDNRGGDQGTRYIARQGARDNRGGDQGTRYIARQGVRDNRGGDQGTRYVPRQGTRDIRGGDQGTRYVPREGYRDSRDWDRNRRFLPREGYREHHAEPRIIYRGRTVVIPRERYRRYRDVVIVRPYGHWYPGYAHYHHDDDAYKWLAFTAITLGILNFLNEEQQREHEAAQIAATTAPIGERIIWQEDGASGVVMATREGTTTSGRYCREFQQQVTVGGRSERAYGTACQNPDGSWEVVSSDSQ